jgi:hypothetical protein
MPLDQQRETRRQRNAGNGGNGGNALRKCEQKQIVVIDPGITGER